MIGYLKHEINSYLRHNVRVGGHHATEYQYAPRYMRFLSYLGHPKLQL